MLQAWVPDLSSHVVACDERPGTQAKRQRYLQFLLYRISCSRSSTPCLWCTGDLLEPSPAREFHTSRAGPTWRSKVMKVINTNQFLTTVVLYEWVAGIACTFWYCPTLECCVHFEGVDCTVHPYYLHLLNNFIFYYATVEPLYYDYQWDIEIWARFLNAWLA